MASLNINSFKKQIKSRVANWDDDKITIGKKDNDYAILTVILDGKLRTKEVYYRSVKNLDFLVPILEEYFATGTWDDNSYYIKYTDKGGDDLSRVFIMTPNHGNQTAILTLLRVTEGDKSCGIKSIPKGSFTATPILLT